MGAGRLLTKFDFLPFFQVDLLLPILGNLGTVCHCWTTFRGLLKVSYSITARVPCCIQDLYQTNST